jgi:3'(2'), 5'-bisphosphate nucleotidase
MNLSAVDRDYLIETCRAAGAGILAVYDSDFEVQAKKDSSPLTEADLRANRVITDRLRSRWPEIPVLSEEAVEEGPYEVRKNWPLFWLVDPLDGTREFVKRNGQFTVNIALIENGRPVAGFVYAPVSGILYYGTREGAFKMEGEQSVRLPSAAGAAEGTLRVAASLSHSNRRTEEFLEKSRREYARVELLSLGSSLKLCLVAEGKADIYPRFGPTMEWDTAAAHAVVTAAGGRVTQVESDRDLEYNKENLHNPWFIVRGAK